MPKSRLRVTDIKVLQVEAIHEALTTTTLPAGSTALDLSKQNDFSFALDGNVTFTFDGVESGRQGIIAVRQQAAGGRTVTFTSPDGWTLYQETNTLDLQAAYAPNSVTLYTYAFVTNIMFIGRLLPVVMV